MARKGQAFPHSEAAQPPLRVGASAAASRYEETVCLSLAVLSGVEGNRSERASRRSRGMASAYKQPTVSFKPKSRKPKNGVGYFAVSQTAVISVATRAGMNIPNTLSLLDL